MPSELLTSLIMLQELEIKALKGESKTSRLKIKPDFEREPLKKPDWIRIRLSSSQKVNQLKKTLREQNLFTVCEEAQCPNLNECFNHGTATFMTVSYTHLTLPTNREV